MSSTPSFQTIRLSRGRHATPSEGACVMELASMLAHEPFSDRPRSVCPVLGMVLRAYNDGIDDERRQDLYRYASALIGTHSPGAESERLRRCERFFRIGRRRLLRRSRLQALGRATLAHARFADAPAHAAFLRLIDELVGAQPVAPSAPAPAHPDPLTR